MFNDEKIKLIQSMPEGDAILVIWIKLLCMAGKVNDYGSIYVAQDFYYTDEMLAVLFEKNLTLVRLALNTFEKFGMISRDKDGKIEIENWAKHQNIDGMERIKDGNAERQRVYYYRKKLQELGVDTSVKGFPDTADSLKELYQKHNENLTLGLTSGLTLPNGPEEDKNKNKNKNNNIYSLEEKKYPYEEIISYLNQSTDKNYKHNTRKSQELIRARMNEGFTLDDFKKVIDNKTATWKNDSSMNKFLRPETLFGTKFESYLNEKQVQTKGNTNISQHSDEEIKRQQEYIRQKMNRKLPIKGETNE